jgi:CRISPR/Cas system CSM-associated protein Csm3 (group 7 of RAMP superfamily)
MARELYSRIQIRGTLTTLTPLHVGGHGESADTDLPLAQNGRGDFYIPGTSITGVLRAWCQKNFDHIRIPENRSLVDEIFGFQNGDDGQASFVIVEDVPLSKNTQSEIRDGVGINRFVGTAAEQAKFDRAILPRETALSFAMTIEIAKSRKIGFHNIKRPRDENESERKVRIDQTKAIFGLLLSALQAGSIRLGAGRTRGLGRVKLTSLKKITEQRFSEILSWLSASEKQEELTDSTAIRNEIVRNLNGDGVKATGSSVLEVELKWRPKLPVMVKAGYDGIGVDALPLTTAIAGDRVALVLPGSSIKGALRSHGERIMRTLITGPLASASQFHEQIDDIPLVEEIFGARKEVSDENTSTEPKPDFKPRLGLAALVIDDCYAQESINADLWRSVESARDNELEDDRPQGEKGNDVESQAVSYFKRELWKYLRQVDEQSSKLSEEQYAQDTSRFKINHHVAIDRWTGGTAEGSLFSILVPAKVEWEPMRLTLDFARIAETSRLPSLMFLLLILRDAVANRLPFGFATNRGMGEIQVEELRLRGRRFEAELAWLNRTNEEWLVLPHGDVGQLDTTLKEKISKEWKRWLMNQQA